MIAEFTVKKYRSFKEKHTLALYPVTNKGGSVQVTVTGVFREFFQKGPGPGPCNGPQGIDQARLVHADLVIGNRQSFGVFIKKNADSGVKTDRCLYG